MEELGSYIENLRCQKRWSGNRLAKEAGVSQTFISQIERGKKKHPQPEILQKIANALVDMEESNNLYTELMIRAGYVVDETRETNVESGTVSNKLGKGIIALRKENGLSQVQFAERVGISQTYVSDLESGKKNPTMKTLDDLLSCFDTDYIEFAQTYMLDEKPKSSNNIGKALKDFREEKGITQTEWAEKSGINRNYISDAENGRNNPSRETITKLVEPFDVSYVHFLFKYCGEGMDEKRETESQSLLEQNFNKLTPENQKQVSDFIEFLISRQ